MNTRRRVRRGLSGVVWSFAAYKEHPSGLWEVTGKKDDVTEDVVAIVHGVSAELWSLAETAADLLDRALAAHPELDDPTNPDDPYSGGEYSTLTLRLLQAIKDYERFVMPESAPVPA